MGFGSGGEEEGEKRQIGRDCAYFSKQILILVTISERSSAQPLSPQVLQAGRKCKGGQIQKFFRNPKSSLNYPILTILPSRAQCGLWTILNITRRGTRRGTTSGPGKLALCFVYLASERYVVVARSVFYVYSRPSLGHAPPYGADNDHKKSAAFTMPLSAVLCNPCAIICSPSQQHLCYPPQHCARR